ncbi:MAG: hypothetical protein OHK0031_13370 [Anaerolineales bacterium]
MKASHWILMLIVLLSGAVSISIFSVGQLWYDDFAGYLLQSQAILRGEMPQFVAQNVTALAASDYPVGPAAYPWGYPLLVAPIFALSGLSSLTAYKLVNVLAFAAFLIVFHALARRRLPALSALLLTAALAFNPALLQAQDLIQADFVFLCLSTLALLQIEAEEKSAARALLLGMTLFAAFFVRTNGILLPGVFLAEEIRRALSTPRPGWRFSAGTFLIFLSLTLLAGAIFPNGQTSYFTHYGLFFTPARLWQNFLYYLALPGEGFSFLPGAYPLTAALFLLGAWRFRRQEFPILLYIFLSLALFISWPERQGLRFLYPIFPLLLLIAARALASLTARWRWLAPAAWGALAALALFASLSLTGGQFFQRREINGPFDEFSQAMFAFVRENTLPESQVIFFKPRLMTLLTGRPSLLVSDCARLGAGDFLVLHKKGQANGQVNPTLAESCNPNLRLNLLFENKRFLVYQISP